MYTDHVMFKHSVDTINWQYETGQVFGKTNVGLQPYENRKAIYRNDTGEILSVCGKNYHVVQPQQMQSFYDEVCDKYGFKLINFKALKNGKRLVGIADVGTSELVKDDLHNNYLVMYTACDGSSATKIMITSVRMACTNALQAAVSNAKAMFYLSHRHDFNADDAVINLDIMHESYKDYYKKLNVIANTPVNNELRNKFVMNLLNIDEVPDHQGHRYHKIMNTINTQPGAELDSTKDTLYGLVNSVTYLVDHKAKVRGGDVLQRAENGLFGQGNSLKNRAFDLAYEMAA